MHSFDVCTETALNIHVCTETCTKYNVSVHNTNVCCNHDTTSVSSQGTAVFQITCSPSRRPSARGRDCKRREGSMSGALKRIFQVRSEAFTAVTMYEDFCLMERGAV
jgi:hypothetical protein